MNTTVAALLRMLFASAGLLAAAHVDSPTLWALALAAAVVLVLVYAGALPFCAHASRARPDGAIDVSVALAQSDPDAAGHPRSRAPGFAVSAA